jgi:hypothetical protein
LGVTAALASDENQAACAARVDIAGKGFGQLAHVYCLQKKTSSKTANL